VSGEWESPAVTVNEERLGRPAESDLPEGGFSHSSPAMALMFVLLNGLMASSVLVTERRERTLARLFTAPLRRSEIIAANVGWRFIVGMGQFWILILVGALAFGVDWGDTALGLLLLTVVYVAAVASLSVLIGSLSRTSRQAESFSLVLSLTMCALGGLWWPLEITPRAYQAVGHAVPTGWAMDAMHNLLSRGYGLAGIAPQVLVLLGFAAGFSIVAAATFRHE
jgi:ABC-2 type transport system permease protein